MGKGIPRSSGALSLSGSRSSGKWLTFCGSGGGAAPAWATSPAGAADIRGVDGPTAGEEPGSSADVRAAGASAGRPDSFPLASKRSTKSPM